MVSTKFPGRSPAFVASIAATCLLMLPSSLAFAKTEPLIASHYGPPPNWARYRALAEVALRQVLIDPDSAKISWPNGYVARGFTPLFRHRVYGYATSGLVNSRNRFGGYTGNAYFAVVIDDDRVLYVDVGKADGGDLLSAACEKAVFPRPSAMTVGLPITANGERGFFLSETPLGAFVVSVAEGSAAEHAGLRAQTVVTSVNGVALAGMSQQKISELIAAISGPLAMTLTTGAVVTVSAAELRTMPSSPAALPPVAAKGQP